jgi:hypothetical protein
MESLVPRSKEAWFFLDNQAILEISCTQRFVVLPDRMIQINQRRIGPQAPINDRTLEQLRNFLVSTLYGISGVGASGEIPGSKIVSSTGC